MEATISTETELIFWQAECDRCKREINARWDERERVQDLPGKTAISMRIAAIEKAHDYAAKQADRLLRVLGRL